MNSIPQPPLNQADLKPSLGLPHLTRAPAAWTC